jgi:hypothetical protein
MWSLLLLVSCETVVWSSYSRIESERWIVTRDSRILRGSLGAKTSVTGDLAFRISDAGNTSMSWHASRSCRLASLPGSLRLSTSKHSFDAFDAFDAQVRGTEYPYHQSHQGRLL